MSMFCKKCGAEISDNSLFCEKCGESTDTLIFADFQAPKVILDPKEVTEHKKVKDSSKTFSGSGKAFGMALIVISILGDLIAMVAIGFDAFIPVTIGAAALFVIGFLLMMFSQ